MNNIDREDSRKAFLVTPVSKTRGHVKVREINIYFTCREVVGFWKVLHESNNF